MRSNPEAKRWNCISGQYKAHFRLPIISRYHEKEQTKLLKAWIDTETEGNILITDLFNESFGSVGYLNFLKSYYTVVGIDISSDVIYRGKKSALIGMPCVVSDIKDVAFRNNVFNYVISFSTLDHFGKEQFRKSLEQIRRVLIPGGKLIITLHNAQNLFLYFQLMKASKKLPFPLELYSLKSARKIIEDCHFKVRQSEAIVHVLFPGTINRMIFWCQKHKKYRALNAVEKLIELCGYCARFPTKYLTCKFIAFCAIKED